MSRRLAFFATIDEFDQAMQHVRATRPLRAWKLREGSGLEQGPIVAASSATRPGEVVYLGEPPAGAESGSIRQAIIDWGFIGCVRPFQDETVRCLWLAEVFSTTDVSPHGNPLFVDLKRRVERDLLGRSRVHRLDGRPASGPGPRFSRGALDLFARGYTWRQPGVARMGYAPPDPQPGQG